MKVFPHKKKLESRWWHRAAKVFYCGISIIFVALMIIFKFDDFLDFITGWMIFSAIYYVVYWRGIVYIVYGADKQ